MHPISLVSDAHFDDNTDMDGETSSAVSLRYAPFFWFPVATGFFGVATVVRTFLIVGWMDRLMDGHPDLGSFLYSRVYYADSGPPRGHPRNPQRHAVQGRDVHADDAPVP